MSRREGGVEIPAPVHVSVRSLAAQGLELHRAGNLFAAEQTYRTILTRNPKHADALHLLGLLEGRRDPRAGLALIEKAIASNPRVSAYHNNYGNLLLKTGDVTRAEQSYRRALRLDARNPDACLNLGKLLHGAGDLAAARRSLVTALRLAPASLEAQMSMGRLEQSEGAWAAACACYRQAVTVAPASAPAYLMLGAAYTALEQWEQAERSLRQALSLDPVYADAHFNLGNVQRASGRLVEAVASYQRAIELAPSTAADAWNNLGVTLADLGRGEEALQAWVKAVELQPQDAEVLFNLGRQAACAGDAANALKWLEHAVVLDPRHARAYCELGNLERSEGRLAAAATRYRQAIAARPAEAAEAWNNLGVTLAEMNTSGAGDDAAEAAFRKAVEIRPDYADAWFNLGQQAARLPGSTPAFDLLQRAITLDPEHAKAHQELGVLQESYGHLEEALASYTRSLDLDPACTAVRSNLAALRALMGHAAGVEQMVALVDEQPESAQLHWTCSMGLLLHGRYAEGWREYEWRLQADPSRGGQRGLVQPRWHGEPLEGRSILVYAEQGLGDTLQFARYAPLVTGRGGRVILEVQPALQRLLRSLPGIDSCVAHGVQLPEFTVQVPLMSLPYTLGVSAIPPPLCPLVSQSATREGAGLKVGLAWAGAPGHKRDRLRSIPLSMLQCLASVEGVRFTSLQRGTADRELREHGACFQFHGDCESARDLLDTAEIIQGLDLVITVDTAVAHLAGTLGKQVWILLDRTQDWRWGLDSGSTPWYPSAELFRQAGSSDWQQVIERVGERLRAEAVAHRF